MLFCTVNFFEEKKRKRKERSEHVKDRMQSKIISQDQYSSVNVASYLIFILAFTSNFLDQEINVDKTKRIICLPEIQLLKGGIYKVLAKSVNDNGEVTNSFTVEIPVPVECKYKSKLLSNVHILISKNRASFTPG